MTGVDMLKEFDIHVAQIVAQLHSIEKVAKPFFEKYGLLDDFIAVKQYCMLKSKYHRVEGVAADKIGILTEKAKAIDFVDERNSILYQEYTDVTKWANELDPMAWVLYEQFHNQVVIPREKKNADAVVPAAINTDTEASKEQKPIVQSNFTERYDLAFKHFLNTHPWSIIIKDIHAGLANSNSEKAIKTEEQMQKIEKSIFGFEFNKELAPQ